MSDDDDRAAEMSTTEIPLERSCACGCGRPLTRPEMMSLKTFGTTQYASRKCAAIHRAAERKRLAALGVVMPLMFPSKAPDYQGHDDPGEAARPFNPVRFAPSDKFDRSYVGNAAERCTVG